MPKPYDKTTHDGKTVDWLTHAALLQAEIHLGYRLTIVQGSYHKGVGASAGTHDGGGVVDLAPWDWKNKVTVMRAVGFAIWHRPTLTGVWNEHIHGVLVGNDKVSPSAKSQVTNYFNGTNGLKGQARDPFPRPNPIPTYEWPGSDAALLLEQRAVQLLDKTVKPSKVALRVDGVDLSHHNACTAAGLAAAAKAGVTFGYHKATEGTTVTDATYASRRKLFKAAGIDFGAYHFARPNANGLDGAAEARFFLSVAKPAAGDLRPMLDLEDDGNLTRPKLTAWVGAFVAEVKRQTGVVPVIYTPFDLSDDFGCPLWVARYNNANAAPRIPAPWKSATFRQFSNGVAGVPNRVAGLGHVDLNTLVTAGTIDSHRIGAVTPMTPPHPKPKPVPAKPAPKPAPGGLDFRVHLVPGNKTMAPSSVVADMHKVVAKTPGNAAIVFNTERESPALLRAVSTGLGAGWHRVIDNENTIAYADGWHHAAGYTDPNALLLAKVDPSMANVSPPRYLDKAYLEHDLLPGVAFGAFGTHLVSEANCEHIHVRGRKWREKTYKIQLADVLDEAERVHRAGVPVVLAGDFNTGIYFRGAQLFARLKQRFPGKVTHVHNGGLDHIFLISTDKVRLSEKGREVVANNASDHDMVTALIHAQLT